MKEKQRLENDKAILYATRIRYAIPTLEKAWNQYNGGITGFTDLIWENFGKKEALQTVLKSYRKKSLRIALVGEHRTQNADELGPLIPLSEYNEKINTYRNSKSDISTALATLNRKQWTDEEKEKLKNGEKIYTRDSDAVSKKRHKLGLTKNNQVDWSLMGEYAIALRNRYGDGETKALQKKISYILSAEFYYEDFEKGNLRVTPQRLNQYLIKNKDKVKGKIQMGKIPVQSLIPRVEKIYDRLIDKVDAGYGEIPKIHSLYALFKDFDCKTDFPDYKVKRITNRLKTDLTKKDIRRHAKYFWTNVDKGRIIHPEKIETSEMQATVRGWVIDDTVEADKLEARVNNKSRKHKGMFPATKENDISKIIPLTPKPKEVDREPSIRQYALMRAFY